MKVHLMHPDRDFDPGENRYFDEATLTQDLELTTLFEAMALGDKFLFDVARKVVLSSLETPAAIRYRQEILEDCLRHPDVIRQIYAIPVQAIEERQKHWLGIFGHYPSGILSGGRLWLEMFVQSLTSLRAIADAHGAEFRSRGFLRFFSMIQEELGDAYLAVVRRHLRDLEFRRGVMLSVKLGKGNEGASYVLRNSTRNRTWLGQILGREGPVYSYTLAPRDDAGAHALGELRDRGVNRVANAVAQSADHIDNFLEALRLELAFYIGCLNLAEQLARLGEPIVFPEPATAGERRHLFTGLYDASLALTMRQTIVGSDANADNKDLVIITGANQGGKSTFLRSIGLAQLMMQCGMFVSAKFFSANICRGLFTHFKRGEDITMESGKLDEELGRMSKLVDHISPNAMVLFNESFAATNEREGSEIAGQITRALLDKDIKVFYVTHLYKLANGFFESRREKTAFLRAERKASGERTFRLIEAEPLQTSFGVDVYHNVFGIPHGQVEERDPTPQT